MVCFCLYVVAVKVSSYDKHYMTCKAKKKKKKIVIWPSVDSSTLDLKQQFSTCGS